jgi:hypothetical protein
MTQTFTPVPELAETTEDRPKAGLESDSEPSMQTIRNILAYSRNLEVKASETIREILIIKS